MHVEVGKLKDVCDALFQHLDASGISSVEIDQDYYWTIESSSLYDAYHEPSNFALGRLSDDYDFVEKLADGILDPTTVSFMYVASLLRYLGDKL